MKIELLRHIEVEPYQVRWGKQPEHSMEPAKDFSCPFCEEFSYFCRLTSRSSAALWRRSVVGFEPFQNGMGALAGEAAFRCEFCGSHFKLMLPYSHVLEAYAQGCLFWPKPNYPRLVNKFLSHELASGLADALALLRCRLRCAIREFPRW